eukprot:Nk52_evm26s1569 gene=Nk52_evmTU26s1569
MGGSSGGSKKKQVQGNQGPMQCEEQFILRLPPHIAAMVHTRLKDNSLGDSLSISMEENGRFGQVKFVADDELMEEEEEEEEEEEGDDDEEARMRRNRKRWEKAEGKGSVLMKGRLVDLPCIIESQKTCDNKHFYKTADISQMFVCDIMDDVDRMNLYGEVDKEEEEEVEEVAAEAATKMEGVEGGKEDAAAVPAKLPSASGEAVSKKKGPPSWVKREDLAREYEELYSFPDGITPPMKNVRNRRFRKLANLKKQKALATSGEGEIDHHSELKRLLKEDSHALESKFELVELKKKKKKKKKKKPTELVDGVEQPVGTEGKGGSDMTSNGDDDEDEEDDEDMSVVGGVEDVDIAVDGSLTPANILERDLSLSPDQDGIQTGPEGSPNPINEQMKTSGESSEDDDDMMDVNEMIEDSQPGSVAELEEGDSSQFDVPEFTRRLTDAQIDEQKREILGSDIDISSSSDESEGEYYDSPEYKTLQSQLENAQNDLQSVRWRVNKKRNEVDSANNPGLKNRFKQQLHELENEAKEKEAVCEDIEKKMAVFRDLS